LHTMERLSNDVLLMVCEQCTASSLLSMERTSKPLRRFVQGHRPHLALCSLRQLECFEILKDGGALEPGSMPINLEHVAFAEATEKKNRIEWFFE